MPQQQAIVGANSSGGLAGNYLNKYLGAELGWCFGFVRRFAGYNGKVAILIRMSDYATHDLYFPEDSNYINWADPLLLSFVSGDTVKVAELFNLMPIANRLVTSVTAPLGKGPTIYEGGSFKTLTGRSEKAMDFNGTDEYLEGTFTGITTNHLLYMGAVGENSSTGNINVQSFHNSSSAVSYHYQGFNTTGARGQFRAASSTFTADGGINTTAAPSICSYQESITNRKAYQNGVEQDEDLNESFDAFRDSLFLGRLRATDGIYFGGKATEIFGFLSDKPTHRAGIDATINKDYSF